MAENTKIGERLIGRLIDEYAANDPTRVWASIPVNNDDLSEGYQDIASKQFANAINLAAWWLKGQIKASGSHVETIAYAGPKDVRSPVIAVAALKLGKKLLLCSPFATREAQNHLLSSTNASLYLHARELGPVVRSVVSENPEVFTLEVPEQREWLFGTTASIYPYTKTWQEAWSDPWIIFHTSGTTGLPKPIIYTNWMMTAFDAADLMPDAHKETMNDHFRNKRFYVSMPTLHFVGMTAALQWTTFLSMVLVMPPPTNISAEQTIQVLQQGRARGDVFVPSQIEDVLREPSGLQTLRGLDYVYFAGAPLPKSVAEKLVGHVKVQPAMGTTESGAYFVEIRNEDDWDYYRFRDSNGIEIQPRTDNLCELVFKHQPQLARWQQIFHLFPELDEFHTKDLWTGHPVREDLWRFSGRTDDLVNLSHGESLYVTPIEATIQEHPDIRTAIVGGQGRTRPFVIIELGSSTSLSGAGRDEKLSGVWPYIQKANERCVDEVKIGQGRVIFADTAKPLPRTAKETVLRNSAFALYASEIDLVYTD